MSYQHYWVSPVPIAGWIFQYRLSLCLRWRCVGSSIWIMAESKIQNVRDGERSIIVDTAMRLARYFGTRAGVWLQLQVRGDLEVAEKTIGERIKHELKVSRRPATGL